MIKPIYSFEPFETSRVARVRHQREVAWLAAQTKPSRKISLDKPKKPRTRKSTPQPVPALPALAGLPKDMQDKIKEMLRRS